MRLKRVRAVARKEFLHVLRDPRSLAMAIAIPMVMLVLFGSALTLDVDNVAMVVWDQSQTDVSRNLVSRFQGSRYFAVREYVDHYSALEQAIDTRRAMVGLVLSRDFATRIAAGRNAPIQFIVDGSDANTATIAIGYADVIVRAYAQELVDQQIRRNGGEPLAIPLDVRPRVWFNTELESKNYIVPGLIAVIMMIIAALLTSLTVAREWERGTMEQLISTPVTGPELILGKLIPYWCIGMLDVSLAVLLGELVFHVPLRGNVALVFGMSAMFLAGVLSMGLWISVITKNQLLAAQMAMVSTFLPAFLLSGFMFAIANMPKAVQIITYAIPARYFVALLKAIYLKGVGLEILAGEAILLAIYGALMILLANIRFKKKLT
jgi:ABC-2 type transport system permease protein